MKKPSVTELIGILDKPALVSWANRLGLQGINVRDYTKKRKNIGTKYHDQIAQFLKTGDLIEGDMVQSRLIDFFADCVILGSELDIETEYFTGRIDVKYSKNGSVYICDFKLDKKRLYFENKLQLVAYHMAIPVDELGIISIPDFEFIPTGITDFKPYEQILINLSNIYTLMEEINVK